MFYLALLIGKLFCFIFSLFGRGSVYPGYVAMRICPDFFSKLKISGQIIAVTGVNGKTSTVEFIARALEANGLPVGRNHEGSNIATAAATLFLRNAGLTGKVKRNLVLECDERYVQGVFKAFRPTIFVITNLFRDQYTRNAHQEFLQERLRQAIASMREVPSERPLKFVLNADDPYVAALSKDALWYGVGEGVFSYSQSAVYDDGAFCNVCKEFQAYNYRTVAHLGKYECGNCGHKRPEVDFEVSGLDYDSGELTIKFSGALPPNPQPLFGKSDAKTLTLHLALPGLPNAYNAVTAIAAAAAVGIDPKDAARALDGYELTGGRTLRFSFEDRDGYFLLSKHDNAMSYTQSVAWAVEQRRPCTVVVLVNRISRRYYTNNTSWFWDIDFDLLAAENARSVVLVGRYVNELAMRLGMSAVAPEKIICVPNPADLPDCLRTTEGDIFAVTCGNEKRLLFESLGVKI